MIIQLVGSDDDIRKKLTESGFFTSVEEVDVTESLHPSADFIYLTESKVHVNELYEIRAKHTEAIIYYHMQVTKDLQLFKQIRQVLQSTDVHLLLPHLSTSEVVDRIVELFVSDEDELANPVVMFAGAISGIGTSSTVHAVARRLHDTTEGVSIGVIGLDEWDPGTTVLNYQGSYLDQLKVRLSSRELTSNQLLSAMGDYGYRFLAGNRRLRLQKQFTVDEVSYLIDTAKKTFDIVLIDGGSHFDNAGMLESIKSSSLRYLVTTQSHKAIQRYRTNKEEIVFSNFSLLINRYQAIAELAASRQLASEYDLPLIATIPDLQNMGLIAEQSKKNLMEVGGKEYEVAIDTIVRGIVQKFQLKRKPDIVQRESMRRKRFLGLGAAVRADN